MEAELEIPAEEEGHVPHANHPMSSKIPGKPIKNSGDAVTLTNMIK